MSDEAKLNQILNFEIVGHKGNLRSSSQTHVDPEMNAQLAAVNEEVRSFISLGQEAHIEQLKRDHLLASQNHTL